MTQRNKDRKAVPNGDYSVGYGRPPAHSRFQKGQSGNPKGRPRKVAQPAEGLAEMISRIMEEPIQGRIGDEVRAVSGWEALGRQLRNKALNGDATASRQLILLLDKLGKLTPPPPARSGGVLLIPRSESDADWERRAFEQQAPYRSNIGMSLDDDLLKDPDPTQRTEAPKSWDSER